MKEFALPVVYTLFLWWFSTGIILYLDGLPRRTYRFSLWGATAILVLALFQLWRSSTDGSSLGAYVAFTCGVLIWGWNEISFLMGFVTGPRKEPCPEGCRGWPHFVHATETILHHELAIAASAIVVVAITWGAPNQVGTWTFMVLWWMRLSAKLNVFLGVPNLTEEFLPEHLQYLKRYFTRKPMNLLFPISVTVATVVTVQLVQRAAAPDAGPLDVTGYTFLATLLGLAVLEHWFLVLPLPSAAPWSWASRAALDRRRDELGSAFEQESAERGRDG